jgi:hypothetical protein
LTRIAENAIRSTGPKTARGKKTASRNALKHGLLTREVVIRSGDGQEDAEEFQDLLQRLWADYEPVGVTEEMLVQKIASCWWRHARFLRAENGEIRERLDSANLDYHFDKTNKLSSALVSMDCWLLGLRYGVIGEAARKISVEEDLLSLQGPANELRKHEIGVELQYQVLVGVKKQLTEKCSVSERLWLMFSALFGASDTAFHTACQQVLNRKTEDREEILRSVSGAIDLIDSRLELLRLLKRQAASRYELEQDAARLRLSLPSEEATGKLLRYQAQIERELYRAMDELERIQRRRRGESVPAPLNINLTSHGDFAKQSH